MSEPRPSETLFALQDVTMNFGNVVAIEGVGSSRSGAARSSVWSVTMALASRRW